MQRRTFGASLAATLAASAAGATGAEAQATQRVVYHVGDEGGPEHKHWRIALGNMRNHLDAVGEDRLSLVCVLNAGGIRLLTTARQDPALAQQVAALRGRGARFLVCKNSMRIQQVRREDLFETPEAELVPSGVVELTRLQQQGFAYIRP